MFWYRRTKQAFLIDIIRFRIIKVLTDVNLDISVSEIDDYEEEERQDEDDEDRV